MEKVYYPSVKRFYRNLLLMPIVKLLTAWVIYLIFTSFGIRHNPFFIYFLLYSLPGASAIFILTSCMLQGFRGERLAIQVKSDSIYGPMVVGRDMPIRFDEIDFEKTRSRKRIYSIRGDFLKFDEALFEPEDSARIWKAIDGFEKKAKPKSPNKTKTGSRKQVVKGT